MATTKAYEHGQLANTLSVDASGNMITAGHIDMADSMKLRLGASDDLQVYHDGSNSYISDVGTGDLKIQGANVRLENPSGVRYFQGSSGVSYLYNSGDIKLNTTSTGVDVTGNIAVSGTVDGVDIATRDGTLTTTTTTANAALPKAGGIVTGEVDFQGELVVSNPVGVGHIQMGNINNEQGNGYIRSSMLMQRDQDQITYNAGTDTWNHAGGSSTDWSMIAHTSSTFGIWSGPPVASSTDYTNGTWNTNFRWLSVNHVNNSDSDASRNITFTGTVTADGLTMSDDAKAMFGASNDLEIYHDGDHSYIKDNGSGDLRILSSDDLRLATAANVPYINCNDGGSVDLYDNGELRFQTTAAGSQGRGQMRFQSLGDNEQHSLIDQDPIGDFNILRFYDKEGNQTGFIIGYGSSHSAESNKIAIKALENDGEVGFFTNGTERVEITNSETTFTTPIRITDTTDVSITSTAHSFQIGSSSAENLRMDNNEIAVYTNGVAGHLRLQVDGGEVSFADGSATSMSLTIGGTEFLNKDRDAHLESVTANSIGSTGNVMRYYNDMDASSSGNHAHLFYTNVNDDTADISTVVPEGGFYNNDFYVEDNLSVGRVYSSDGTLNYHTDGTSAVTVYSSNVATNYLAYSQLVSRNSTDPDYGGLIINSRYVASQSNDTAQTDWNAHVLTNGGHSFQWISGYAGRVRRGDAGTTSNYRAADHSFSAYSNTGGTHGESSSNGFTQIIGRETANGDDVFLVSVAGSHRIEFDAAGDGRFDGGADISAADYAEYFEWADGNPDNEDRRGYSVVLVTDGKIRKATTEDSDDDFLGVVSAEPGIVGDSAWAAWTGRYQKDIFGAKVKEQYTMYGWGFKENEEDQWEHWHTVESAAANNLVIPDDAVAEVKERPIYADDYDPNRTYIRRKDRPEWSAIGMMGKLPLFKGQPTHSKWRKLFDLSDQTEMWLVR